MTGEEDMQALARWMAFLLERADRALTYYRARAAELGFSRPALSDLATFGELQTLADEGSIDVTPEEAMALLIERGEQPTLGGGDDHFAEAVYGGHADDVRGALQRLGLLKE